MASQVRERQAAAMSVSGSGSISGSTVELGMEDGGAFRLAVNVFIVKQQTWANDSCVFQDHV